MSSIDKVKVGDITYDVSPGSSGTLNGYTSNDNVTPPPAWSDVSAIASTDTNSGIFGKLTSMVRNVRWLYSKLGTTDFSNVGGGTVTGALSSLQTELSGKADSTHSHTTGDLPVTNSLSTNSASYIPSSSAVYSLQSIINDLNTEIQNMNDQLDPNKRYESKSLGTWSSTSDVDTFLSRFNHDNLYKDEDTELALGNYVTIEDGANNVWEIAGFDMEHNQLAADGTTYDNGYGICMVPKTYAGASFRFYRYSEIVPPSGYSSASIHHTDIPNIVTQLENVLASHIVERNVLLSTAIDDDSGKGWSASYSWKNTKATCMSVGQLTGTFASNRNSYDDGEATYKLPLFDHEDFKTGHDFWTRGIYGHDDGTFCAFKVSDVGAIEKYHVYYTCRIRPMIYIR